MAPGVAKEVRLPSSVSINRMLHFLTEHGAAHVWIQGQVLNIEASDQASVVSPFLSDGGQAQRAWASCF